MMGKVKTILFLIGLFLTSCSVSPEPVGSINNPTNSPVLPSKPISTNTIALTPTPDRTEIPGFTPTEGPAPDLEIVNFTLDDDMNLMADIRNNTQETMIFLKGETVFEFYIDLYEKQLHDLFGPMIIDAGGSDDKYLSCVLYPGEIGVLSVNPYHKGCATGGCPGTREELDPPLQQKVVHMNRYTSYYKTWDDIKEKFSADWDPFFDGFNPKPENIIYEVQGEKIRVQFDLDIVFPNLDRSQYTVQSWIVLYDEQGQIINILSSYLDMTDELYFTPGRYHIDGIGSNRNCSPSSPAEQCWKGQVKMTDENMSRLDHMRIFVDLNESKLCEFTSV
jgi:hypothetical protein